MVLKDRFIHERNTSTYPNEIHDHWGFISYDRSRKILVMRQFHQEGFVNQYVMKPELGSERRIVFESESFENLPNSMKARETYDIISNDEFTETFEIAEPGKPFAVYSKTHLKRRK